MRDTPDLTDRPDRPNVVVVQPDQMGATWMGVYGHPEVETPRLDRFAQGAATFDRAYTVSPLCTPARASLWTGQYPQRTGVRRNHDALPRQARTVAHAFGDAGYDTLYLGKWHLSGGGDRGVPHDQRGGFRRFYGWEAFHVDHWAGKIWGDNLDDPQMLRGHETDGLTDVAIDWLGEASRTQPFFLTVNYQAPHAPCSPPPRFAERYRGRALQARPNVDPTATMRPQYGGERRPEWEKDWRGFVEGYYAEITHLDEAFGRLLDAIDGLGLARRTIVVFTSDHGENAGAFGRFEKHTMNEESIRIPLLIRTPGLEGGRRTDHLYSNIDLAPTLLDLCGLPPLPAADGVSHAPCLRGDPSPARTEVFSLLDTQCVHDGRMKLETERDGRTPLRLTDLQDDPYEMTNALESETHRDRRHDLSGRMRQWTDRFASRDGSVSVAGEDR